MHFTVLCVGLRTVKYYFAFTAIRQYNKYKLNKLTT